MYNAEIGLEYQTSTVNEISKDFGGSDFDFAIQQEDRNKLWTARYDSHFYKYTYFLYLNTRKSLNSTNAFYRHKLYYAGLSMRAGCRAITTDACVPISKLPEMLIKTREDIDKAGLTGMI